MDEDRVADNGKIAHLGRDRLPMFGKPEPGGGRRLAAGLAAR
jgi:hypothetical protein